MLPEKSGEKRDTLRASLRISFDPSESGLSEQRAALPGAAGPSASASSARETGLDRGVLKGGPMLLFQGLEQDVERENLLSVAWPRKIAAVRRLRMRCNKNDASYCTPC